MTRIRSSGEISWEASNFCRRAPAFAFQSISHVFQRCKVPFVSRPLHVEACSPHPAANKNIVILGGSSGVGREAAKYLESQAVAVEVASRRTGFDFRIQENVVRALKDHRRAAVSVGAGREVNPSQDAETDMYKAIIGALAASSGLELAVIVLRSLILEEVRSQLRQSVKIPWVLLRPGPLVDNDENIRTPSRRTERVLVTTDIRCNGLVSRAAVGMVVGDLLSGKVPLHQIQGQTFGVYDLERMINHPHGTESLGKNLWQ